MSRIAQFKAGALVRLKPRHFMHSEGPYNPVWGGKLGHVSGTVLRVHPAATPSDHNVEVRWANGNTNYYKPVHLCLIKRSKDKALAGLPYRGSINAPVPAPTAPVPPAVEAKSPRSPAGTPPAGYRWLVEGEVTVGSDVLFDLKNPGDLATLDSDGEDYFIGHPVGSVESDFTDYPFIRKLGVNAVEATETKTETTSAPLPRFPGDAEPRSLVSVVEATIQPGDRKVVVHGYDDGGCRITAWIGNDVSSDAAFSGEATEVLRRALNLAAL